jgi:cytochrome c oxidase subunit II
MTMKAQRWFAAAGVLLSGIALAEVAPMDHFGLPTLISKDGERIDWLMNATHFFNIILFVIMCVWMGWACLKHNHKHTADYDHGDGKRNIVIAMGISAFIFFVVDGNLFVNTLIDLDEAFWNFKKPAQDPNTVRVEVNAHQWAWDFRYAGPDKKFGTPDDILTWNELKVPLGVPVSMQLASVDVIHSIYFPNLRVKMDAVPGQINRLWFSAEQPGDYDIGCAQHCGTNHYKMKAMLTVMPPDAYRAWEAEASVNGLRAHDPEDKESHWAWEWKEKL